ncbi:Hypothetical protein PHPALM_1295 [Phytophthora palmivora]|uniref:Uncharacterized protein n=1 Tax=Phytophthora palmivora TaxID=4796 RepID=A0A2P4YSQ1_9STRA|nr:Hypothetical protein PHPALM_1295 [Phytophthora palmivora]
MASPHLLNAAIRSDGVQEAPYTLLCMVVALEKASLIDNECDILKCYTNERDVSPVERVLQAADEFSLQKNVMRDKYKLKRKQKAQEDEDEQTPPQTSSVHIQTDLERLLCSTSRVETRKRLEEQLKSLRYEQIRELTGVSLPKHLQITMLEEDPLEFRRDTHGVVQVCGRNILGEHYAPKSDPLRFLHIHPIPELFKRMKHVMRDDLSTRNKRRIAALNAKERERKKELEKQGILSPEQQLEAKFDKLLNANVA